MTNKSEMTDLAYKVSLAVTRDINYQKGFKEGIKQERDRHPYKDWVTRKAAEEMKQQERDRAKGLVDSLKAVLTKATNGELSEKKAAYLYTGTVINGISKYEAGE